MQLLLPLQEPMSGEDSHEKQAYKICRRCGNEDVDILLPDAPRCPRKIVLQPATFLMARAGPQGFRLRAQVSDLRSQGWELEA